MAGSEAAGEWVVTSLSIRILDPPNLGYCTSIKASGSSSPAALLTVGSFTSSGFQNHRAYTKLRLAHLACTTLCASREDEA